MRIRNVLLCVVLAGVWVAGTPKGAVCTVKDDTGLSRHTRPTGHVHLDDLSLPDLLERLIADVPRPFVLIDERELSVLRRGLARDGWKRRLYLQDSTDGDGTTVSSALRASADRWLREKIVIPARSGHYHHFFCECGSRLQFPSPLREMERYKCPACGNEYSGERYDGAVRYIQHNRLSAAALTLALVYAIEREQACAAKAAEILVGYANAYPGPHTSAVEGGMMYQSLCEAVWVIPLAQAYDLIYDSGALSADDRALIEDKLLRPVALGLKAMGTEGNWGSWHLSAVGVVGFAVKDAILVRYALDFFAAQIANQLGDDGLWPESVHTYHFYPLSAFVHLAEACWRAGIDIYNWEAKPGKSLKAMFTAPLDYMYPSFQLPAINDGWFWSFLPLNLYEIAFRRWEDPLFGWVLKQGYGFGERPLNSAQRDRRWAFSRSSLYALLFGRDIPGGLRAPVFRSTDFPGLGICTLRVPGMMATFDYGPFMGHGHLDKFGFTLFAGNTILVPDYGTPGYGSAISDWYRTTAAHNTVAVDGRSQKPALRYGLKEFHSGNSAALAVAEADDCYDGVTHKRLIMLWGRTCLISDVLESDEEHDYDWFIRCNGQLTTATAGEAAEIDTSCYPQFRPTASLRLSDGASADWACENGRLLMGLWSPGRESIFSVGECPAETAARSASMVICRQRGRKARFSAALVPAASNERVEVIRQGCVVRTLGGGWEDCIYVRSAGDPAADAPLHTDGRVAAVRVENGEIRAIALSGGTWVQWKGERVLQCPAPVECVEVTLGEHGAAVNYCADAGGNVSIRTAARAIRVNGKRIQAAVSDGHAQLNVTPELLSPPPARLTSR